MAVSWVIGGVWKTLVHLGLILGFGWVVMWDTFSHSEQ